MAHANAVASSRGHREIPWVRSPGRHIEGRSHPIGEQLLEQPWHQARPGVQGKLQPQDGELYGRAQYRVWKERAIRRRRKWWELSATRLTREELLMKLGARSEAKAA